MGPLGILAVTAGLAALFSPCSFPLLATLLAGERSKGGLYRTAVAFTAGAALFLLLLGVAVGFGAGALIERVSFGGPVGRTLRLLTGLIMIGFGLWQVRGRSLSNRAFDRVLQPLWERHFRWRRRRTMLSHGLYGFGYILAGFGWTGPILAGLALQALAMGNVATAVQTFTLAAATIVVVMAGLALAIGQARESVVRILKVNTQRIKQASGVVLTAAGGWLIALAIWADQLGPSIN